MRQAAAIMLAATAACHVSAQVHYVAARTIILECATANDVEVSHVDLWVTTDNGRTWTTEDTPVQSGNTIQYTADYDGRFGFSIILNNDAGPSGPVPQPGTHPAITIVVDTVPPLLQLHQAQAQRDDDNQLTITLSTSLIEEDLSSTGIRIFYKTLGNEWTDGGCAAPTDNTITWSPPGTVEAQVDLRIVATDLAGNRATSETITVEIPPAPPTFLPSHSPRDSGPADNSDHTFTPVLPPILAPVQPVTFEPSMKQDNVPPPLNDDDSQLRNMRDLAQRFMKEGRYSLAAARFEDAARLAPTDSDTLVDLGSAHYRLGHLDQAQQTFQSATDITPDHLGAIEGLALVAATQKRYPQAREHLRHLLRLQPQSGATWLRYGDVEHRLGNTTLALEAWRKAISIDDADTDLQRKAERRLEYFGTNRSMTQPSQPAERQEWQQTHPNRQSSSSSATKRT